MDNIVIEKLLDKKQIPWDLLLLADPSKENISRYIDTGEIYVAKINYSIVGIMVLYPNSKNEIELKNVAVNQKYQGKGYGKQLILKAIEIAKIQNYKRVIVGTGNTSVNQQALYQKCGFSLFKIEKDYFTKNYPEAIYENGVQCRDMIMFAIDFN
jgi:ribosomal protein S18 acetylase RimI-like enzyme